MKTSIIERYRGMDLETSIGSRKYIAQIRNNQPIEITMRDSSKERREEKKNPLWYMSNGAYPCYVRKSSVIRLVPEEPKPIWSVDWDDFPIADCFYLVNNVPHIKTRKKNSVKKYFETVIFRLNKLKTFL